MGNRLLVAAPSPTSASMAATSSPDMRGLLPRPARGFTMGELIVAIVITAILLAAAVPTFTSTTNNVQIETARMTLGGILREARTLRAVNVADHTYTWEEAITDATADMGSQLEAVAFSSVAGPVGVSASALASGYDGECMFADGETFGSSWTFLCTPGGRDPGRGPDGAGRPDRVAREREPAELGPGVVASPSCRRLGRHLEPVG